MEYEKFVLYADVNGFERVLRIDMRVDLSRIASFEHDIAAGHGVQSYSYSKIARLVLHQACDDHFFTSIFKRLEVIADAWQNLEREYIPQTSSHTRLLMKSFVECRVKSDEEPVHLFR